MIPASFLLAAALEAPEILAVRCEQTAAGVVIKVLATAALQGVSTDGSGEEFVISIPATLPAQGVELPKARPPVLELSFEADAKKARLHVGVAPGTTLVTRSQGSLLALEFHAGGDAPPVGEPPDLERLYPLMFPGRQARTSEPTSAAPVAAAGTSGGLKLGPFFLKPALVLRYVDATSTFLDTPSPVRARYLEILPSLGAWTERDFLGGRLTAGYEPRFRTSVTGVPVLGEPSHFFSAGLDVPVGASLWFSAADQYGRGTIETQVVDPGREYFFDIGSFKRNQLSLAVRSETASRFDFSLGVSGAKETLAPQTGYFDNDRRTANAAIRYELTPLLNLSLGYDFERVPPPVSRPLVESNAHTVSLRLDGELSPLLRAEARVGYRRQDNPLAPPQGNSFRGLTFGGSLLRQLASGAELRLGADRSTQLSGFENNAYYVATGVQAGAKVPLVWAVELSAGISNQWNRYELIAQGLAESRRDELFGWTAGLARPLTRWSYLRADYSWDRRSSNIPGLSTQTHAFILQLGLGLAGGR